MSIQAELSARILSFVVPIHIVGGLLLFATGFAPVTHPILEDLLASSGNLTWSPIFAAVLGPTIASWGVLFAAIVSQFLSGPTQGLWRAMVWSVAVWAPLDTALCLRFGVYSGAILNAAVVVTLLILLLNVRKMAIE